LQQLSAEVQTLRLELHRLQLEQQQEKLARLEREQRQARESKQRLAERESELNQDLAECERQLGQTALSAEERQQLEAARAEIVGDKLGSLREEQERIAQRETELNQQIEQGQQRLQELLQIDGKLKGED
jgi:hypothetical protein